MKLYESKTYNWKEDFTYADNTGNLVYSINLGGLEEIFVALYRPKDNRISFFSMHYSSDWSIKFSCFSFDEADMFVTSYANGSNLPILPIFIKGSKRAKARGTNRY